MTSSADQVAQPEQVGDVPLPVVRTRLVFWILAAGVIAFGVVQSMTIPVLAPLQQHYGTDQTTATWVLTAYLLSASVATPLIGRLGDSFGKKRLLVITLLLLTLGLVLAALAPSIETLLAARIVQGFAGGLMPLTFGLARDTMPAHRVAPSISILTSLIAAGMAAGMVLGGPVIDTLGVHWLFWLPGILTAIAAFLVIGWVPESSVLHPGRPALVPAALMSACLVCLLLGVSQGPKTGWSSPWIVGLLLASLTLGFLWVRSELRARIPFVDMAMMRLRPIWAANLVALMLGVGMFASYAFAPQFMQTDPADGFGFGSTVTESGLMMLPTALVLMITGWLANRLAPRIGARGVVLLGSTIAAVGSFWFALAHDRVIDAVGSIAVMGLGIGLSFASLVTVVVAAVPPQQTGVATGMNTNIRNIGGALGSAMTASILTASALTDGAVTEGGYVTTFLVLGVIFVVGALATLAIPVGPCPVPSGSVRSVPVGPPRRRTT